MGLEVETWELLSFLSVFARAPYIETKWTYDEFERDSGDFSFGSDPFFFILMISLSLWDGPGDSVDSVESASGGFSRFARKKFRWEKSSHDVSIWLEKTPRRAPVHMGKRDREDRIPNHIQYRRFLIFSQSGTSISCFSIMLGTGDINGFFWLVHVEIHEQTKILKSRFESLVLHVGPFIQKYDEFEKLHFELYNNWMDMSLK